MNKALLEVSNLKTHYFTSGGIVKAVDGISFELQEGETLGVVGESGCGKSSIGLSIMRLVPNPPGRIVEGQILLKGEDLLQKSERDMIKIRGANVAMSFQDPTTYLNPVMRVGDQICEAVVNHQHINKKEAMKTVLKALEHMGIPSPSKMALSYPFQLSGGMRQRVMIAMSLSCRPEILIADEPTIAVDVIIQAQIIDLLKQMQDELGTSFLLITHDFGLVAELSDKVAVIYAGKIVEYGDLRAILSDPLHPYTRGLLESIPTLKSGRRRLKGIPGTIPDLINPPSGCRFHTRCSSAQRDCREIEPPLIRYGREHFVACHVLA